MTSEQSDQYRREIIRSLESRNKQAKAKALNAEAEAAKAKLQSEALEAALLRAYHPPLSNDICLSCWINHGDKVTLKNIPQVSPHGMRDRFVCSECGYAELREA